MRCETPIVSECNAAFPPVFVSVAVVPGEATVKPLSKKTLLAALPFMGLLLTAPSAALAKHHHHCWSEDRYGYDQPAYDDDYDDRGYSADRYGYGARPSYDDPYAYGGRPYYGEPSPYGGRPYYDGISSADPYAMDPSSLLPALLGLLRPGY
jgi:hypothetical protein